jgi:SpoIID/LytB domain protein
MTIEGAGFGHGVGMSQYGAYARALDGQSYTTILNAYYTGSSIGILGGDLINPGSIYTNVASDMANTTLTVLDGPGSTHTGMLLTRLTGGEEQPTAVLNVGDTAVVNDTTPVPGATGGCEVTLTIAGVGTVWESGTCDLTVELTSGDETPAELVKATNCRTANCTFGYGTALILIDNGSPQRTTTDSGWKGFDLVVQTTLDEYTRGIAEVPYSWPMESLKTQAVAARSYAASIDVAVDHAKAGCFCDVKNTSSYQVYAGWVGNWASGGRWDDAATATSGEVVKHSAAPDYDIVRAYYSSSNGGASEWVKDKWGSDSPYLVSVPDPFSVTSKNPLRSWTFTPTLDEVVDVVWGTSSTNTLIDAEVIERNVSGSARTVRFTAVTSSGTTVTKNLSSASVTSAFRLYSWYFDVQVDSDVEPPPPPSPPPPVIKFTDIDDTVHKPSIEYLASVYAAVPCDDGPDKFCPHDRMRREDLAAFMVRALDLPATSKDFFTDDDGLPFEDDINALALAGITKGCNPPANTRFCPNNTVSRGQTAAFIVRAWNLTDSGKGDWFIDDNRSIFERDIDRLATARITLGCNPPSNTRYCPDRLLSRGEMSSFLARALKNLPTP